MRLATVLPTALSSTTEPAGSGEPPGNAGGKRAAAPPAAIPIRRRRSAPVASVAPKATVTAGQAAQGGGSGRSRRGARSGKGRSGWRLSRGTQLLLAALCWVSLAALVYLRSPADTVVQSAFFTLLFGALFFTLTPLIHAISLRATHSRLYHAAAGMHATRQGLMLSGLLVLNAFLQMQRAWTPLTALLLFSVFAIIEIVALARR